MIIKQRPKRDLGASPKEIITEASRGLDAASRRVFLKQVLSLGTLSVLTGIILTDQKSVSAMLAAMSRFNDGAQAKLFNPNDLARTYTAAEITKPFPFNAFYGIEDVPHVNGADFKLELSGRIQNKAPWTLAQLNALPQQSDITRHICVEGWSAIGQWGGVRFSDFLQRIGADTTARYVGFTCADDYYTSIDMATALHPQTILALNFGSELKPLSPAEGFPLKLRIPTKLGFKNPKHIMAMSVTNRYPGGYWEDKGYNWFSGS